jgi:hypothetical protein
MSDHTNRPFFATLISICYLVTVGALLSAFGKYTEALGVGAAVTGLIGIARIPSRGSVTVDNTPANPVQTTDAPEQPAPQPAQQP